MYNKGKVLLRTDHEGPGEQMYGSTFPSTSVLDGCVLSAPRPGRFTPGKDPVSIVQEARLAPGPVWTGAENLAATGIRSPHRPASSESLYRLSYTGSYLNMECPFLCTFTEFRKTLVSSSCLFAWNISAFCMLRRLDW